MKNLSKTTKILLTTLGVIGVTSAAFAATTLHNGNAENDALSATQAKVSLSQAISIAQQNAPGNLTSAKFDNEKGGIYEIELANDQSSHEVKINANTGAVIKVKQEVLEKDDVTEFSALRQAKVDLTQAMQIASQTLNGQAIGGEFIAEHGKAVYEVEVLQGNQTYDVTVDANTGFVLTQQIDKADNGADEENEGNEKNEREERSQIIQPQAVHSIQSA